MSLSGCDLVVDGVWVGNIRADVTEATHVPADSGDAITNVIAKVIRGETDYPMSPISIAQGPLAAGDLVALGVTTAQRSPALPDVPTLAANGGGQPISSNDRSARSAGAPK